MSEDFAQFWMEGGVWMYPIALIGCALVPATLGGWVIGLTAKKATTALPVAVALLAIGLAPAMLGELGYLMGIRAAEMAVVFASPADQATIMAGARGEALATLILGLWLSLIPACGGASLLGVALMRRATAPDGGVAPRTGG